eukprot:c13202_g1_i1.p1 GENE.c13202_g1_i1~~c13202_g1_i1.p1  ORF type:complete len:768 (+),score=175.66 c13202_g1_i1:61-2304(+)
MYHTDVDIDASLRKLDDGACHKSKSIAANNFQDGVSAVYSMDMQELAYKICTAQNLPAFEGASKLHNLYTRSVEDYINSVLVSRLSGQRGEVLLQRLVAEHANFEVYVRMMGTAFGYLNRFYIPKHNLPKLLSLGMLKLEELVLSQSIGDEIRKAALNLIEQDRNGEKVDRQLIRDVVKVYVRLGVESPDENTLAKYTEMLEGPFCKATQDFYANKSALWVQDSLPEYLIKVEGVLKREQALCDECFPGATSPKLNNILNQQVLTNTFSALIDRETGGFEALLTDMRKEDMRRLYSLYSRVQEHIKPLAKRFCDFLTARGSEVVKSFDATKDTNPEVGFVNKLIELHLTYRGLLEECFLNDGEFHNAIKVAFEAFMNQDARVHGNQLRCAELLSTFCDTVLRATGEKLTEQAMEETLTNVVHLFSHLNDKDMFSEFYRKQLARRLLGNKSASDDAERLMIQNLKMQCGAQFTSKLEGMVKDLTLSKEHQQNFKDYITSLPPDHRLAIDFDVQVLTTGHWPSYPILEIKIPDQLLACMEIFKAFYESATKHRRLRWLHSMGTVSVNAKFKKSYELAVSTPQACILLLFNTAPQLTCDEVRTRLNLSEDEVRRQLMTLALGKFKVLKKEPTGKTVSHSDVFSVNDKFESDKKKIKIPTISSKELSNDERVATNQAVVEDRKHAIDAAIVRIMKMRKQLEFQKLVLETSQQLMRLFQPDVKLIKSRMEDLIVREYLERDPNNAKVLRYLA